MKQCLVYAAAACSVLFFFAAFTAEGAGLQEDVKLVRYDVSLVTLGKGASRSIGGETVIPEQGYLFRLHGTFPAMGARLMRLYVGQELIEEYGGFAGGIYFIIGDAAHLEALSGKPFGYQMNDNPLQPLGMICSPEKFRPFAPKTLLQALGER